MAHYTNDTGGSLWGAYSNANTYEEYVSEVMAIEQMLKMYGMEKRFTLRSTVKNGRTLYYFTDLDTRKDYPNLAEARNAINAAKKDFRTNSTSRQRNVTGSPVTVTKGARLKDKTDQSYANAKMLKVGQLRNEYAPKIKAYNSKRGATVLALSPSTSESTVYEFINPNGAYMEYETFERAKADADKNIIIVDGKPWDRNVYNYAKHSAESIGDSIYHCLIDEDFMNLRMSQLRFGKF